MPSVNVPHLLRQIRRGEYVPQANEFPHFNYKEAMRLRYPIYDVLIKELEQEGVITSVHYFKRMVKKENELYAQQAILRKLSEDRPLLLKLFEYIRVADLKATYVKDGGEFESVKLLYKALKMLGHTGSTYEWLMDELLMIITKYIERIDDPNGELNEMKARIYYLHGSFLSKRNEKPLLAVETMEKAFHLCKSQNWEDDSDHKPLLEGVSKELGQLYLVISEKISKTDNIIGFELVNKAVLRLAEISTKDKFPLYRALVAKLEFIVEKKKYDLALNESRYLQRELFKQTHPRYAELKCKLFLQKGLAYYNLKIYPTALLNFRKAYTVSRVHNLKEHEADILFFIGKTHAKSKEMFLKARYAFLTARKIYKKMQNMEMILLINFFLAQVRSNRIFPFLMDSLRSTNFCKIHSFRQWKLLALPFWPHISYLDLDFNIDDELMKGDIYTDVNQEEDEVKKMLIDYKRESTVLIQGVLDFEEAQKKIREAVKLNYERRIGIEKPKEFVKTEKIISLDDLEDFKRSSLLRARELNCLFESNLKTLFGTIHDPTVKSKKFSLGSFRKDTLTSSII